MSGGLPRAAAPAALLLAACQVSYLAQQGDRALAEGDDMRALSLYDQALRRGIEDAEEAGDVAEKRYQVAMTVAERMIADARTEDDDGRTADAFNTLARLVAAESFGVEEEQAVALGLMHAMGARMMDQAEAEVAAGRTLLGARTAQRVAARFPEGRARELDARAKRLVTVAAQHHLRLAAEAKDLEGARYVHLRIAQRLDPTIAAGDVAELEKSLRKRAAVPISLLFDPAECGVEARIVAEQIHDVSTVAMQAPLRVEVVLERCTFTERTDRAQVVHAYADTRPVTTFVEEPFYELVPSAAGGAQGGEPQRVLRKRSVPVTRQEPKTSTITVDVTTRTWQLSTLGKLRWFRPGGPGEVPLAAVNSLVDQTYWSPDGAKLYAQSDKKAWMSASLSELARNAINYRAWLDSEQKQLLLGEANTAYQAGDRARAEDRWVLLAMGGYLYATESIEAEYGMIRGDLANILAGTPAQPYVAPGPAVIPEAYADAIDYYDPIDNHSTARGASLLIGSGVDLAYTLATSPLAGADLAGGVEAVFRLEGGRYTLRAETPWFGGQASGFSLGLVAYALEAEDDDITLMFGARYTRQDADGDESYALLAPVAAVEIPLGKMFVLDAGIELNVLALKTLADDGGGDTRYYSPIHFGLSADLWQHAFVRGSATHYLGVGSREPIHVGLEVGLRL